MYDVIKYGANYRLSENYFDEDIDDLICSALSKVGSVECVDRDYDLLYELNMHDNKYLCYVEIAEVTFGADGRAKKFISTEKCAYFLKEENKIDKLELNH